MTTIPEQPPICSTRWVPIPERIGAVKLAWETIAPEEKFAGMTMTEFTATTVPSIDNRATLALLKTVVKAGIGERALADKETRLLIKRVLGGVIADANFGPDCAFYRAMGFVRTSERQSASPSSPAGAVATRSKSRRPVLMERLQKMIAAWNEYAPEVQFAGMTLAQFKTAIAPSELARASIEAAQLQHKGAVANRADADAISRKLLNRVVSGVKSAQRFGDDSPLYRAMGYRPVSERRTAKRATIVPAPVASAA